MGFRDVYTVFTYLWPSSSTFLNIFELLDVSPNVWTFGLVRIKVQTDPSSILSAMDSGTD